MKKEYFIYFLMFLSLILLVGIIQWGDYLIKNGYVGQEAFDPYMQPFFPNGIQDSGSPLTSHNVDLPLTTTVSCQNKCGPSARCYLTGQQCTADIDCPGCRPYNIFPKPASTYIRGENDAGKISYLTPQYSKLTTDMGTQAKFFGKKVLGKPAEPNHGINTWRTKWNVGNKLFQDRYQDVDLPMQMNYPARYLMSGEFIENGPLAANAYL